MSMPTLGMKVSSQLPMPVFTSRVMAVSTILSTYLLVAFGQKRTFASSKY
jgi:hypothetical protein